MKAIVIAGRTGKDATLRRTQSGDAVLSFSVAVDDGYGQNKRAMWFDVSLWGKRGEALEQHLRKGTAVAVSGDLSTREHEGKTYLTVKANEVTLQGGGEKQDKPAQRQQSYAEQSGGGRQPDLEGSYGHGEDDGEIPF